VSAITFVQSPPGLSPLVDFALEAVADAEGLFTLRADADPDVRLFIIDAPYYLPDYSPEVTLEQLASIGALTPEDVQLYVVATLADGAPAANLMAPILLNALNGEAAQVILDGDEWPLRAPLVAPAAH
jgi:flagellar assembly factor FliW